MNEAMPAWVAIGVKCVCICDNWGTPDDPRLEPTREPMKNEILTIAEISPWSPAIAFEEIQIRELRGDLLVEYFWAVRYFKPLITENDDIELFRSLLKPTLAPELVD